MYKRITAEKYIKKCPFCREYAENVIIRDDEGNYIECPYCGVEIDVPEDEE